MIRFVIILILSFVLAGCDFLEVDKCLDRGGKWDYENSKCVLKDVKYKSIRDDIEKS